MVVQSIDIYATYRCDMRCGHCFMGGHLDTFTDFDLEELKAVLRIAGGAWGTESVSFLGGEPTLYPQIHEAIAFALDMQLSVSLVSNGRGYLTRVMASAPAPIHVSVSLDGPTPAIHDSIRRRSTWSSAIENLELARRLGHSRSAVVSVGAHNIDYAIDTIRVLDKMELSHINVHYVSDRGFATPKMLVSPTRWARLSEEIQAIELQTRLRFEHTFVAQGSEIKCAARDKESLIFFPDGKVYECTMFVDMEHGHSYEWHNRSLHENTTFRARLDEVLREAETCPAVMLGRGALQTLAGSASKCVDCIFHKVDLSGREVIPSGALLLRSGDESSEREELQ